MNNGRFVSRAGEKLEFALTHFNISVEGKICADFGCSTGGFTDCLLQHGAKKVYTIDTAYGELAWNLRNDSRVVVMERTNALFMELSEKVDIVTIDVAWTKQEKSIPKAMDVLKNDGIIISLIKPHYEADPKLLKNGKLPDEESERVANSVVEKLRDLFPSYTISDPALSPVEGEKAKNKEYLITIGICI